MYNFPLLGAGENRCEICGGTFADKDLLKGHLLIHLEERPLPWEMHQMGIISRAMAAPPPDMRASDVQKPFPVQPPTIREPVPRRKPGLENQKDGFMCDMCGSHFTSLSGMTRHRQKHLKTGPPTDRKHRCPQCGYSSDNIANLVAHVRAHTGDRPFKCDVCEKSFSRKNTLDSHKLVHTEERPFECEVCGKRYKSERTLVSHERKHAPFTCDACGESFAFLRFLKAHERREHASGKGSEDGGSRCEGCGQAFPSPSELQGHLPCPLARGDSRGFQCPHCPFSTDVRGSLNAHVRRMHVGKGKLDELRCEVCGQAFSSSAELQGHQRKHRHAPVREGEFRCPHCPFSSDMKGHLNSHVRRSHVGERRHECKVCGKAFFEANKLNRHLRTHSGKCVFVCGTCGLNFTDWAAWRAHEKSHSGWEILSCSVCGRVFLKASDLRDHERGHLEGTITADGQPVEKQKPTDEKDKQDNKEKETVSEEVHKCIACSQQFSSAADLKRHQRRLGHASRTAEFKCGSCDFSTEKKACLVAHERRMHGGEKSHLCEVCGRAFFEACKLKRHLRLHTGERPFTCSTCGKGFVGSTELRRHERLHSGEMPYSCGFCSKRFMLLYQLKNHEHKHRVLEPLLKEKEEKENAQKEKEKGESEKEKKATKKRKGSAGQGKKSAKKVNTKKRGKRDNFKCKTCNSSFSSLCALVGHKREHKKRKHRCKKCFYVTQHVSCLTAHMRTHLHHCKQCSKAFSQKHHLDAHLRNHKSNPKTDQEALKSPPKSSNPVGKQVVDEAKNAAHAKKETQEDFSCSGCGRSHGSSSELQKHILEEHMIQELSETSEKAKESSERLASASEQLKKILEQQRAAETDKDKEIGVFKCDSCDRIFSTLFSLKKHLKSHANPVKDQKYHCSLCSYSTAFRLSLKYHLRSHLEPPAAQEAPLENGREEPREASKKGGRETAPGKRHRCTQCSYTTAYSSNLKVHVRRHRTDRPLPCPLCPKRFKDGPGLRSHMRTHSSEKGFACPSCNKQFKHRASLRNHECTPVTEPSETDSNNMSGKPETGKEPSKAKTGVKIKEIVLVDGCQCKTCEELLRALNEHRKTHLQPRPPPSASEEMQGKAPLKKKRPPPKKRVTRKPKRLQCTECDYSTLYATNFKVHQRRHIKQRVFKCEVCGDLFTTQSAFTCHKKSHPELQSEFSHRCSECDFATSSERKLATHVDRMHVGKRPHRCDECGKSFFQPDELKRHLRCHTGERPFACATCDKRFTIRGHLTIHERTHLV